MIVVVTSVVLLLSWFRPFIKWLDRNLEAIVTEGLKQVCKAYYNVKVNNGFYVKNVHTLYIIIIFRI
jgi:hypothetical protein